jgi:hypothetical protein
MIRAATNTADPITIIDALDPDAIRAELDALYERESALRAALKLARARQRRNRRARRQRTSRQGVQHE